MHQLAAEESLVPIRPGSGDGRSPFWNAHAMQFIHAPAFDFKPVEGAASYRFTLTSSSGGTTSPRTRELTFDAQAPSAALTPVWLDVPVGTATVIAVGMKADNVTSIAISGTRQFHRAAAFGGPYGKPILPYAESVHVALDGLIHETFVQHWRKTGKPDPAYPLYRYSSKLIGGLLTACTVYAKQTPRPPDADEAIDIGHRAADYLISISRPSGEPMEFFPPTYHDAKPTERENDNFEMLISPAEAGQGYLNLYGVTHDSKYLDSATSIAATYAKMQRSDGTWPLKFDRRTNRPLADIELIPSGVILFLDRLVTEQKREELRPTLNRAVSWIMNNPVRNFNWQAQFDDAKLRGAYENLGKHEACEFAIYLLRKAKGSDTSASTSTSTSRSKDIAADNIRIAEELIAFAEDQFVTWEQPPAIQPRSQKMKPENWFTPCSLEQYAMFEPISGSSAFMIMAFVEAFKTTGKPLYLAKAESLANALTAAQQYHHGRYPTRMIREDLAYWANSSVNTIRAMMMLADVDHPRARQN